MPKTMADSLNACQKALFVIAGEGRSTPAHLRDITNGYRTLRTIITDLATDEPTYLAQVEAALTDIHRDREYAGESDMVLRDLADISLTLARVKDGKTRSNSMKLAEAAMFCQHLRDELRADEE